MQLIKNKNKNNKIFILAGESSGDYIGSCIMRGIKQNSNNLEFFGIGGNLMEKEGLSSLYNINEFNIIGFLNTIIKLNNLKKYINEIVKIIFKEKPNIVITIDTKGFSLSLAKALKSSFEKSDFRCPLIHFVPPTIWAYGKSRIKKWKNLHDELICLYKIEEDIFKRYTTKCVYLGNPIVEKYLRFKKIKNLNLSNSKQINCLLLPGSRNSEIKYILPEFLNLIKKSEHKIKNVNWIIPTTKSQYSTVLSKVNEINIQPIKVTLLENNYEILDSADIAIACSGTITLELVLFKIPTIAVYKTDFLSALIGRMMVNFKNVILPNFLLKEDVVPFLFQEKCNYKQMQTLLNDYIKNKNAKKKLFEKHSKKILQNMSYLNSKSTNFTSNSGKMVINLINNYER